MERSVNHAESPGARPAGRRRTAAASNAALGITTPTSGEASAESLLPPGVEPSSEGSVTQWIALLKEGCPDAAQRLWQRYFERLVRLARKKLGLAPRRAADEEDVALAAFHALCEGAARRRFPELHRRDNLWALLVVFAERRALDVQRHEMRRSRKRREAEFDDLAGREPTPEFAVTMAENTARLLDLLKPSLREVAVRKLEGLQNVEIAAELHCGLRTIERRLENIRHVWSSLL